MARKKNLKIQMHKKIDELISFGKSKHQAKKEYRKECEEKGERWNPSKAEGIYSCRTADAYRQTVSEFSSCLKEFSKVIEEKYGVLERTSMSKDDFVKVYSSSDNKLFDNYTSKIDNHSLRAEYAQKLYSKLVEDKECDSTVYYRGYDKDAISAVSRALGHNRLDVVIDHYLDN